MKLRYPRNQATFLGESITVIWRGSTDAKDRVFAVLAYFLPLCSVLPLGGELFRQFPPLALITIPLTPIAALLGYLYSLIPFGSLVVFFILFLAVVRNEQIRHFIRYNTMQAILIDIVISLFAILFLNRTIASILPVTILITLQSLIFTLVFAVCIYAIVQSVKGNYAEIPVISNAVYSQVP